jgi:hypothetical protein
MESHGTVFPACAGMNRRTKPNGLIRLSVPACAGMNRNMTAWIYSAVCPPYQGDERSSDHYALMRRWHVEEVVFRRKQQRSNEQA